MLCMGASHETENLNFQTCRFKQRMVQHQSEFSNEISNALIPTQHVAGTTVNVHSTCNYNARQK